MTRNKFIMEARRTYIMKARRTIARYMLYRQTRDAILLMIALIMWGAYVITRMGDDGFVDGAAFATTVWLMCKTTQVFINHSRDAATAQTGRDLLKMEATTDE